MTENWLKKDRRYTWHPFTQHETERDPVVITRARGACLYDESGGEMLDMISSWWTCVHGHAHPEINRALAEQASRLQHVMFAGFTHPPAVNLAEALSARLPGDLNRIFFSDNGSTSVEVALKLAYQYWKNKGEKQRTRFIAFEGAYHGDTLGAMSLGQGCGFFKLYEDLLLSIETAPFPDTWEDDEERTHKTAAALEAFKTLIDKYQHEVAAIIVEPLMQGAGGIRFCTPDFMREITAYAQGKGLLVVYDEVATGFGRTGALFACDKIGVTPDLICLSKGLTAGYMPMGVTVATDRLFAAFLDESFDKAFVHGHSFTANPLACAVALKSLELFKAENTLGKIAAIEAAHRAQLPALQDHPGVHRARVMGPVLAFNLAEGRGGYKSADGEILRDWYLSNGLNIRPLGNAVYLMPPYCITEEQLQRAYSGLFQGLNQLERLAA